MPEGVAAEHAAFATVGAIAMQGVRRAEVALGETACVIGLGLVGQLVVRLLVASGVQVVGLDVVPARCRAAEKAGALACAAPDDAGVRAVEQAIRRRAGGGGADHILLAAGGDSNGPVELAARLARDRARVVDIGKTRLDLPWNAYYDKELDVRFSRSYGPGRYDDRYELDGVDYPAGYVRWTERRNLACFLDLLADGSIDVASLISGVHPVEDAAEVYRRLGAGSLEGVGFLLSYSQACDAQPERTLHLAPRPGPTPVPRREPGSAAVRVGFIGAGNYATSMLLPHLRDTPEAELVSVATTTSLSAVNAQRKFGFATISTDVDTVLGDETLDAVFIVTRHHAHAGLVSNALRRGLAVFVEKPLALTDEQLAEVLQAVRESGNDRLMVGFNRRFAPLFTELTERLGPLSGPVAARYLVNAGRLTPGSWYLNEELEGSRFVGEGGHFIDTLTALVGRPPVEVQAMGCGANVQATLKFTDGSTATISYLTDGSPRFPKETLDVMGDGRTGRLDNFQRITVWAAGGEEQAARDHRAGQGPARATDAVPARRARRRAHADRAGVARLDDARDPGGGAQRGVTRAGAAVSAPALGWYVHRLRRMTVTEAAGRGADAARRRVWARRQVAVGSTPPLPSDLSRERRFGSPLPTAARAALPPGGRGRRGACRGRRARRKWAVFGIPRPDSRDPDWFYDPATGRRAPERELAFRIQHRDEGATGNVKQVWEMSRHHHVTVLAAAWWVTQNERYADAAAYQLRSWWRANPYLSGVHWTSGIEAGVRLISWVWIRRLLDEWPKVGDLFERNHDALRQIAWHQEFLAAFPSRGSSANNHVVAEAAGRLAAACAFPWFARTREWRRARSCPAGARTRRKHVR